MNDYYKFFVLSSLIVTSIHMQAQDLLKAKDIFEIKYVSDVQISPDGLKIAYLVNFKDIMTDGSYSNLWIMDVDGSNNEQVSKGNFYDSGLSWSNNSDRLAYKSNKEGQTKIYIRNISSGHEIELSVGKSSPGALAWSSDDRLLAFNMFVPTPQETFYELPEKPSEAKWNDPLIYIDKLPYRRDGYGYVKSGQSQLFVVSTDGGQARQITNDDFNHGNPVWRINGRHLISSGLVQAAGTTDPVNTDIYAVDIESGESIPLTSRVGRDEHPRVSKNGQWIAYLGYDDERIFHQSKHLYMMDATGGNPRKLELPKDFDRSIMGFEWSADDDGFYISYEEHGVLKLSYLDMSGQLTPLASQLGGAYVVRPYSDLGGFSVSDSGSYAFNFGSIDRPPEVGFGKDGRNFSLSNINEGFFSSTELGEVEEIWLKSSDDQLDIQGWVVKPPNFDPNQKYPLILEIHGGPFLSYGPYFAFDYQFYAAAGNIVLYINPRGSTGYGEAFAQKIHHQFPSKDYDDLMTAISHMMDKPFVDKDNMFVTGSSGGGVLSAWITTKSDMFRAAVPVNPVMNWYSFSLYTDNIRRSSLLFPDYPWEDASHYLKYSPISYVDQVKTPTLLITGDEDYRTPIADTEQYYAALKLLGIESGMIRVPNSSHEIDAYGSGTVGRLTATLAWFEKFKFEK